MRFLLSIQYSYTGSSTFVLTESCVAATTMARTRGNSLRGSILSSRLIISALSPCRVILPASRSNRSMSFSSSSSLMVGAGGRFASADALYSANHSMSSFRRS